MNKAKQIIAPVAKKKDQFLGLFLMVRKLKYDYSVKGEENCISITDNGALGKSFVVPFPQFVPSLASPSTTSPHLQVKRSL